MITHHPEAELLLDYAAGSLSMPVSLVVASHACLCTNCRDLVERMEDVGGAFLQELEPAAVEEDLLATTLAKLDDDGNQVELLSTRNDFDEATRKLIPAPIRRYLTGNIGELKWRWQSPALRENRLSIENSGYRASLFRLAPSASPPEHGHTGNEYTLVLAGSFTENDRVYGAGDFAHYDGSDVHVQTADASVGCVCLTVLDAPVRLMGPIGRLLNPFLRF